jgi:sugar O-acyltransferase (sialic acid O-acetyltransferase NeuD family)
MTRRIAIFGAGGFAREVLQIIRDQNDAKPGDPPWEPVGFLVDPAYVSNSKVHDLPILGSLEWLTGHPEVDVVIAIGSSAQRHRVAAQIKAQTKNGFATLIHPRAWLGRQVRIAPGTVICAGTLITTDIQIGEHVHVNIGCTIGHDAVLGDFVTLNPSINVSGNVSVGAGVEIGTGSVLIPHANVGEWSILGAGTVATKPIPANVTAVGSPAKIIKTRDEGWQRVAAPAKEV